MCIFEKIWYNVVKRGHRAVLRMCVVVLNNTGNIQVTIRGCSRLKTIIKYELVINKALRSALNYDTPDEQINEFIRFFGKHIGSDRIYIFEDCDEKHVTNNTYEWCADGIVPEIHELQNVDMDIIGWWYQAFDNEKNIIITDIEQIKDEHKGSYNLLKAQNVKNLVVCQSATRMR